MRVTEQLLCRDTGGYQKAGTSSLKRVTGKKGNSQLGSEFIKTSRLFYLDFLHKKFT
jgi:hypothetical protein